MLSLQDFHSFLGQYVKVSFLKGFQALVLLWRLMKFVLDCVRNRLHALVADAGRETGSLALSMIANRNLHPFERFLWLAIVLASIYCAVILCNVQIYRYLNSPTVISVDRNYRGWTGQLPAVTMCYNDNIDMLRASEYVQDTWNTSIMEDEYFYYMDFISSVANATAQNYADLARFAEDERFDAVDLYELIQAIKRPFDQLFTTFETDFQVQIFPVMSERGSCYAINSPLSEMLTGKHVDFKDFRAPLDCKYGQHQCYIRMDLYEGTGTIDVHSPYEVSTTGASTIALHKSDEMIASYKVLETVASKNLRDLSPQQRKCVFNDEETSQLKTYSKSLCLVRCRAIMALEMCNCVPFFYQFVEGPSCNPAGFECLLDFKWPIWALHICKCPSTCNEIEYTMQTIKKSSWGVNMHEEGTKTNMATASFRWDLIPPKVRMRRDVVFTYEDLVVSFGGTIALLLGFSVASTTQFSFVIILHIFEILYSICRGLYCYSCRLIAILRQRRIAKRNCIVVKPANKMPLHVKRKNLLALHAKLSKDSNIVTEDLMEEDEAHSSFGAPDDDAQSSDYNDDPQTRFEFLH